MNMIPVYAGSGIITIWGIAHIAPVRRIVEGFGAITEDNRKIITMEWIAEGLALVFLGALAALAAFTGGATDTVSRSVILASAAMLLVFAVLTALTGARTAILPMKICPFVKTVSALLFITGVLL